MNVNLISLVISDAIEELENSKMPTNRMDSAFNCGYNDGVEFAIRKLEAIEREIKENN